MSTMNEERLERKVDALERKIARYELRISALESFERTLRDVELDVAAIIRELRATILPRLLPENTSIRQHRRLLSAEARAATRRTAIAAARASKPVGTGRGALRDSATKRKLQRQAEDT